MKIDVTFAATPNQDTEQGDTKKAVDKLHSLMPINLQRFFGPHKKDSGGRYTFSAVLGSGATQGRLTIVVYAADEISVSFASPFQQSERYFMTPSSAVAGAKKMLAREGKNIEELNSYINSVRVLNQ